MALNGLQIQKLLPKTNCKECGSNTCLAFAMKLAAKQASLSACPYASEEAKQVLGAASEPPVREITVGKEVVGGETVLYRHEKTFVHKTLLAVNIDDTAANADETLQKIKDYRLERVGESMALSAVAVTQKSADPQKIIALAQKALNVTGLPLIIRANFGSTNSERTNSGGNVAGANVSAVDTVAKIAALAKGTRSVIANVTAGNADAMKQIAAENGCALAVTAPDADGVSALTAKLKAYGFNDLLIEYQTGSLAEAFQTNSITRKAAIKNGAKSVGYPSLKFIDTGSLNGDTVAAVNEILKYGGVCVLPSLDPAQMVALMTLRLNIFTDPQKPIQVEPKIYAIGEPGKNSPVFVTTNFSLTYFLVSGEIENAGCNAWLVIPECEGMSVLTAWAAGKFSGAKIAKFVKDSGLETMTDTREIIIPGYVSQISGEVEEGLPGWKVLVGPQESADIEAFIKQVVFKK